MHHLAIPTVDVPRASFVRRSISLADIALTSAVGRFVRLVAGFHGAGPTHY